MISLISVSINLYNTLETSEEEQSRLEEEAHQASKDRQCLGQMLGMGVSPGTRLPDSQWRHAAGSACASRAH